jgi:hypothetical protein
VGTFFGLTRLRVLILSGSTLGDYIKKDTFQGLPFLEELNLCAWNVHQPRTFFKFHIGAFNGLSHLTSLSIRSEFNLLILLPLLQLKTLKLYNVKTSFFNDVVDFIKYNMTSITQVTPKVLQLNDTCDKFEAYKV